MFTMCEKNCCAREFKLDNLLLQHKEPVLFVTSQWSWPPVVYVIYRWVVMVYVLVWLVLSGLLEDAGGGRKRVIGIIWFTYLTNWIYTLLAISLTISALTALHHYLITRDPGRRLPNQTTWYHQVQWAFYNMATGTSVVITTGFWTLYATYGQNIINAVSMNTHLVNGLYVIADLFISAMPVRLLHCWHPVLFGITYVAFAILYQAAGATEAAKVIYVPLDFFGNPPLAVMFSVGGIVLVVVLWCGVFGLYKLRVLLSQQYCTCGGDYSGRPGFDDGVAGYAGSALYQANEAGTTSGRGLGARAFSYRATTKQGIANPTYVTKIDL